VSVKEDPKQLASDAVAKQPSGIAVRQDDSADVLLRQPDHVAVIYGQVAAVIRVDRQSMPFTSAFGASAAGAGTAHGFFSKNRRSSSRLDAICSLRSAKILSRRS
jgi:hypothetical protein